MDPLRGVPLLTGVIMPKVTLTDLSAGYGLASSYNANNTAIETAFDNTLSRDGSTPNTMGAELDMNSNKIVNVANGVNPNDAVNLAQVQALIAAALAG